MLRNQTWLDQTSTLGYNVAGTWNNLGYKNDPTTTTAAHVGNHRTRVIAGDAQAWPFKSTGFFFLNPNWHELCKQEKCSSLAPPRGIFYKTL